MPATLGGSDRQVPQAWSQGARSHNQRSVASDGRDVRQKSMTLGDRILRSIIVSALLALAAMAGIPSSHEATAEPAKPPGSGNPSSLTPKSPSDMSKDSKTSTPKQSPSTASSSASGGQDAAPKFTFTPVAFDALPGWATDDHLAALKTFAKSCERVLHAVRSGARSGNSNPPPGLLSACEDADALLTGKAKTTKAAARSFFESHFTPHRIVHDGPEGMLTGYYEPIVEGARKRDGEFTTPLMKRPKDLVNLVAESERGAQADKLTHARKTKSGNEPYPTRRQIDEGVLAGKKLELIYLRDPIEVFFMQIQGSGRIALPDGKHVRVTYDGKNGHPYTSIGRYLIDKGWIPANRMSLQALREWLRKNPDKMREVLWQNASYVFFRELEGEQAEAPMGVLEIPLTTLRSLAVDTRFHAIGTPVYVSAPDITHITADKRPFQRLMIAQDVGSAIRGPERGDIYCGSGDKAGRCAGITKHRGTFFALLPRTNMHEPVIEAKKGPSTIRQAKQ